MGLTIGIVTPAKNSGVLLERTADSVLRQKSPPARYAIWEADNADGSLDAVRAKYGSRIEFHCREDKSQYDAVARGLAEMDCDILAWLNAGDLYFEWTLQEVERIFCEFPEIQWIMGRPASGVGIAPLKLAPVRPIPAKWIQSGFCRSGAYGFLAQEAMFWRRNLYMASGGLDVRYELAADFELWTRMARHAPLVALELPLALFLQHGDNRSTKFKAKAMEEVESVCANAMPPRGMSLYMAMVARARRMPEPLREILFRILARLSPEAPVLQWRSRSETYRVLQRRPAGPEFY